MKHVIKTLLLWMLLLVLPAQAIATAAKMSCGPNHHATLAEKNVARTHHDANHGDHHHAENEAAVSDTALPDLADASPSDSSTSVKSAFCSACAACCVGAAVVSTQMDWSPSFTGTFIPALSPPPSFTGYIPAGLERPPRHIFS